MVRVRVRVKVRVRVTLVKIPMVKINWVYNKQIWTTGFGTLGVCDRFLLSSNGISGSTCTV